MSPAAAIARTTAQQVELVLEHRLAQWRRDGRRRALRRCEDLAEVLGALGAAPAPRDAAVLCRAARAAARDLDHLVAGRRGWTARRACRDPLAPVDLERVVEQLDTAIRASHAGSPAAQQRALELLTVLVASVEAMAAAGGR
jgi:hypothetical protein